MFKSLKRKFVIINMSLLTFVFIAIFALIYVLTALSGERQLSFTLDKTMNAPPKPFPAEPRMATSLLVEVNNDNEITVFSSFITLNETVIREAVIKALENKEYTGKIEVGDFYYSYLKKKVPSGFKIALVDRSALQENLKNILFIFILVTGGSLIILFFISVYLANRAIRPIKEAFEKQEQFVADASHELKTPLAIIKTNLSVISSNQSEPVSSQIKWLGFIQSQTERMSTLINDMLSLAKMDSVEHTLLFQNINFSNLLEGILLSFEAPLFENNITLKTSIQEDIHIFGDENSLERLINILFENAIKNTPQDGVISISLTSNKNNIIFKIKNTGNGISPKHIDKIFERFYRADSSRARESGGFGLGLAIAKSIVEKHNGKIYAQSNYGVDTSFIVKLYQKK